MRWFRQFWYQPLPDEMQRQVIVISSLHAVFVQNKIVARKHLRKMWHESMDSIRWRAMNNVRLTLP